MTAWKDQKGADGGVNQDAAREMELRMMLRARAKANKKRKQH